MMSPIPSIKLLGVRVDNVNWDIIDNFCLQALSGDKATQIVTVNGEFILAAQKDEEFRNIINSADLVIPDSTNVKWFGGLQAVTPGSDLTLRLAKLAVDTNKKVFLLGGFNDVAAKAAEQLQRQFPGLEIAGTSGADPDDTKIPKAILDSGANIVLIAYGAPKQEKWIHRHKQETGAQILVGIGGTFNMLAGTLPRAPKFFRALHFEWLWRLIIEPKRWRRIWNSLVVFPLTVLMKRSAT